MKKLLFVILLSTILMVMPISVYGVSAENCLDEADIAFLEFMNSDCEITYTRRPLYDEQLEQSGWQYNFRMEDTYGFALITNININSEESFEVEEVYYEQNSPFEKCLGLPVYITFNQYIDYYDECYIDLVTKNEVNSDLIEKFSKVGFGYSGSGNITEISETISYASKTENTYGIKGDLPKYSGVVGATNCANVAGGIIIGYYDRFCEDLIPKFKTYNQLGSLIIYKLGTAEISNVLDSLYTLMGTDVNQAGTTFNGFQNGMTSYANSHGYTYFTESILTSGRFDFSKYKKAVENNKPVALFLSNFSLLNQIQTNNGQDIITSDYSNVSHVIAACGYKQQIYYNSNEQQIAERIYLKVSSGFSERGICYLNINSVSKIDKAISITIC